MLAAEAVRLLAMEALLPTTALVAGGPYPTLAGRRVFDSCGPALTEIDAEAEYTPVLSLHTPESSMSLRGPMTHAGDAEAEAVLDIIAELCVVNRGGSGEPDFVDAMADGDPQARLVLAALAAQVRAVLEYGIAGTAFRRLVREINGVSLKTFAVPEYGLRWQRMTMRYRLSIRDDDFDMVSGGLPEPIKSVCASLPAESYAKAKLEHLAAAFSGEARLPLASVHVSSGPIEHGPDDLSP